MNTRTALQDTPQVVNIGLPAFAIDLGDAGVPVVHVDWQPPAGGDERLVALLVRLEEGSAPMAARPGGGPTTTQR